MAEGPTPQPCHSPAHAVVTLGQRKPDVQSFGILLDIPKALLIDFLKRDGYVYGYVLNTYYGENRSLIQSLALNALGNKHSGSDFLAPSEGLPMYAVYSLVNRFRLSLSDEMRACRIYKDVRRSNSE